MMARWLGFNTKNVLPMTAIVEDEAGVCVCMTPYQKICSFSIKYFYSIGEFLQYLKSI